MTPPILEPRAVSPGWNARVYAVVRQCPAGFVTTYGQVATLLGSPRVARHVGFALAALVQGRHGAEPVPWHRVVNSQGRISHRGDVRRASQQQRLLEREGVVFDARGRVDLRRFLYTYPSFRWPEDPVDPDEWAEPKARAKAPRDTKTTAKTKLAARAEAPRTTKTKTKTKPARTTKPAREPKPR